MFLEVPFDLALPSGTKHLIEDLKLDLSPDDGMYHGNDRHYLSCGASALNVLLSALRLANAHDPASILDFGCGAGRVTRWIRAAFPKTEIDVCDLREQDLTFCRETFDVRTWTSGIEIGSLQAPGTYDLIWLGSVITHLSVTNTISMLKKMLSWTNRGGLVLMSFHGRRAENRQDSGEFKYIHEEGWKVIKSGYQESGYGYADYEGQNGYGISLTKLSWMARLLEQWPDVKVVLMSESAWDGHHDVLAIQSFKPLEG